MIYRLPSRASRTYRGKYPTRIAQSSGRKGVYHVELNDGRRYVGNTWTLNAYADHVGMELGAIVPYGSMIHDMSLADYSAVVFVTRLMHALSGSMVWQRNLARYLATGE